MADVYHAPAGVVAELERGLRWHERGLSGDGLTPATVRWARKLVRGDRRMSLLLGQAVLDADKENP